MLSCFSNGIIEIEKLMKSVIYVMLLLDLYSNFIFDQFYVLLPICQSVPLIIFQRNRFPDRLLKI